MPNKILSLFLKKADDKHRAAQTPTDTASQHRGHPAWHGSTNPRETQLLGASFQVGEFFRRMMPRSTSQHTTEKSLLVGLQAMP